MRTINFGKYLRLFQIEPIKTVEFKILQIGKKKEKTVTCCTVCNIYAPFFPIWITCYPPMRTINFGEYVRLFQIEPIKTVEFRIIRIGKKGAKMLHTVQVEKFNP
jgi:hypothetical protein